jgi:hypothetical protein
LTVSLLFTVSAQNNTSQQVCNGHAELCNRSYGVYSGNLSRIVLTGRISPSSAHTILRFTQLLTLWFPRINITTLQDNSTTGYDYYKVKGIILHYQRLILLTCAIQVVFCMSPSNRTNGRYQGGPLIDYLKEVKTWLDSNPNEGISQYCRV